jgi:hypothetical protein
VETIRQAFQKEMSKVEFPADLRKFVDHYPASFFAVDGKVVMSEKAVRDVIALFQGLIDDG